MKTSQIQAILMTQAVFITALHDTIAADRKWLRDHTPNEDCTVKEFYKNLNGLRHMKRALSHMVALQIDLKRQLQANKQPKAAGSRRKHNRADPRYVAWYTAQHAERNADINLGNVQPASCGC